VYYAGIRMQAEEMFQRMKGKMTTSYIFFLQLHIGLLKQNIVFLLL
jgi:hypothetical protein